MGFETDLQAKMKAEVDIARAKLLALETEAEQYGIDILDKVPMIPGGPWANHPFWGTVGIVLLTILLQFWHPLELSAEIAILMMTFLVCYKKWYDYVTRGPAAGETLAVCIGRAVITVALAIIAFIMYFRP